MTKKAIFSYENIIKKIIAQAKELNLTAIRANLPGHKKPDLINGYMPDLVVWHTYWMYIYVVITTESFDDPEKTKHITAFSKYAAENFERLVIITPKETKEITQKRIKELKIEEYLIMEID